MPGGINHLSGASLPFNRNPELRTPGDNISTHSINEG